MSSITRTSRLRPLVAATSLALLAGCAGGAASSDPVSGAPEPVSPSAPGGGTPSANPAPPVAPGIDPSAPTSAAPASAAPAPDPVLAGPPSAAASDPAPGETDSNEPDTDAPGSTDGDEVDGQLASVNQSFAASDRPNVGGPSYFLLRRDVRRCAAPLCGGFFVSRVNSLTTFCVDGAPSAECYVTGLDFSALGLSSARAAQVTSAPEDVLLAGEIVPESTAFGELGRLQVTEAWQGHAGVEPEGAFLRVVNEGIVCITNPCLSFSAEILNARLPVVPIAEIDLEGVAGDAADGLSQLSEPEGLLVAALPEIVSGPGGRALGLDASEYYVPIAAIAACGSRGLPECAARSFCAFPPEANCGRADMPGTCAPRPEACTEQYDPVCGCDGQTYGNACAAASAGVSVETAGECASSAPSSD